LKLAYATGLGYTVGFLSTKHSADDTGRRTLLAGVAFKSASESIQKALKI